MNLFIPGQGVWPRPSKQWAGCWKTHRIHSRCQARRKSSSKDCGSGRSVAACHHKSTEGVSTLFLQFLQLVECFTHCVLGSSLSRSPQDGEGTPLDVQVQDNGNGTYTCSYTPRKPVKHTVMVSWGGVNIPESPFRVSAHTFRDVTRIYQSLCRCLTACAFDHR